MSLSKKHRALLQEIVDHFLTNLEFPDKTNFRLRHEDDRHLIDELVKEKLIYEEQTRQAPFFTMYKLRFEGLLAAESPEVSAMVRKYNALLPVLRDAYRENPSKSWAVEEFASRAKQEERSLAILLTLFLDVIPWGGRQSDDRGLVASLTLSEGILDIEPIVLTSSFDVFVEDNLNIRSLGIDGYRSFKDFVAELGKLTVIIGANATGKSSLLDFLRFVSFAAQDALPPEIDPSSKNMKLFHVGGPEAFSFEIVVNAAEEPSLRYEVELHGPIGVPRIASERVSTAGDSSASDVPPFTFLELHQGKGFVRKLNEPKPQWPSWTVEANELALRRALDPSLVTLSHFQSYLSRWRFYGGFDVSYASPLRRPVPTHPSPMLDADGSNLSAVLLYLMTEHQDAFDELQTHLRTAIPSFRYMKVRPDGGPGTVIGTWREEGLGKDLTFAELSEGSLRFLSLCTLCLQPKLPPLICVDEPELGLHPRVLPVLAGLFEMASERSQVIVTTHSPYFLSQFDLADIAVMRKEEGRTRFKRPVSNESLRREIEEIGSAELARLHLSDELEVRS